MCLCVKRFCQRTGRDGEPEIWSVTSFGFCACRRHGCHFWLQLMLLYLPGCVPGKSGLDFTAEILLEYVDLRSSPQEPV